MIGKMCSSHVSSLSFRKGLLYHPADSSFIVVIFMGIFYMPGITFTAEENAKEVKVIHKPKLLIFRVLQKALKF